MYGQTIPVRRTGDDAGSSQTTQQHVGFGTRLVRRAFEIAQEHNYEKIAVISGVGVKNYYKRFGFEDENMYMTHVFPKPAPPQEILTTSLDDAIESMQKKFLVFVKLCIDIFFNYDMMFMLFLIWYFFYRVMPCAA